MTPLLTLTVWMSLLSIIEAASLTLLRIGGNWQIILASSIYALGVVPLLLKTIHLGTGVGHGIGMINFIWNVFSTILMFAIGIYFFEEKVSGLKAIGVLLCILGIGFIMISDDIFDK